ncbi:two-component system sensor histidine kinase/response regulator [Terrihabitans soli]|uniref:histidine kinase n=1 Tax=Terrihabitans soli TaxID=708113 RepID=A0A6S6QG41_9HYPH|nr:response regulator [Terrihabitans soli]BCJ90073.1 two-component system sensor histidine kinase/response regulator [Terrihabitans soli]
MSETSASSPSAGSISVLYIDDDAGLRRLVEKALTRHGFVVHFAANGDEGLELLQSQRFDVVTVDHYMPGKDGLATLEAVRKLPDPPPVIYVTGADESRIAVAALKAGAADYVIKDVDGVFLELLRSAVAAAVEQRDLKRQRDEAERLVREGRDRAVMLLREVNHRVANSLQLVSSLVTMQSAEVKDGAARDALAETQGRIAAIGQIHRRLYTSDDVRFVEIGTYLEGLVEELQHALKGDGRSHAIKLSAENVLVPTDRAVSLGMIVTELVTNAYKYAYPNGAKGEIRVRLGREGEGLSMCVEDDGVGWTGAVGTGSGLGTKIINSMARAVGSPVEFDREHKGTRVVLRFSAE